MIYHICIYMIYIYIYQILYARVQPPPLLGAAALVVLCIALSGSIYRRYFVITLRCITVGPTDSATVTISPIKLYIYIYIYDISYMHIYDIYIYISDIIRPRAATPIYWGRPHWLYYVCIALSGSIYRRYFVITFRCITVGPTDSATVTISPIKLSSP
jgi:hypothetical protein